MTAVSALRGEMLDVRGTRIFVRRGGSGEPLLFLHGPRGIDDDAELLATFAQHFDVIAPDHPGFGRSDDPEWLDTIGDLAYFYADVLERLDLHGVHLVGHALGGWTAVQLALRDAARLRSLTLASAAGIRVPGVARGDMYISTPQQLGEMLFVDPALQAEIARVEEDPERVSLITKNRVASAKLTWHPRLYDPTLAKWLHRVKTPTLVLWGERDRVIPVDHAHAYARAIAGASVHILPGAGHLIDQERPAEFAAAVRTFAKEIGA